MAAKNLDIAKAKWDDIINENEVVKKLGLSKSKLRQMRQVGEIKYFRYLLPSTKGNPKCPGKKPVYSIKELTELFSATAFIKSDN